MKKRWILLVGLVAILAIVSLAVVFLVDALSDSRVVLGERVVLARGETEDGDLLVLGGTVLLEEGSRTTGDVVVVAGTAAIVGTIEGNLVSIESNTHLFATAVVEGDLMAIGGGLDRDQGAVVRGQQAGDIEDWEWHGGPIFPIRTGRVSLFPWMSMRLISQAVLTVLLMAVLGGLLAVLWPQAAARVGQVALASMLPAVGIGLLTVIVVAALVISICLTAIGLPAGLVAGLAAVFGWLAIGNLIGNRLIKSLTSRTVSPFWTAMLGSGLLTLIGGLLDLIPCVGWVVGFLVMCVGLGAVILTRFGTQDYPDAALSSPGEDDEAADS